MDRYATWLRGTLAAGTDDWPIGRERHDALVALRAFDGLDADAILELGWQKLAEEKAARVAAAREVDPDADEATVLARIKADGPPDFAAALELYRSSMLRARAHLIEHDLVTVPDDERIDVIETPDYLRNVLPFAAYFSPAPFDTDPKGIYVVTPSVGDDPDAMLEHNIASISNTSIHEAYPGHHLQLDAARRIPSLTRLLTDAPEFVEGWGMYSELMMREQGFDADARYPRHPRTPTRSGGPAGSSSTSGCTAASSASTRRPTSSSSRPASSGRNAAAEVGWYTYRPTYPLSYLLGRTLLLGLRADEQRRLGERFSLKGFHDTLLRNGSLPISFHRRALAGEGAVGR